MTAHIAWKFPAKSWICIYPHNDLSLLIDTLEKVLVEKLHASLKQMVHTAPVELAIWDSTW